MSIIIMIIICHIIITSFISFISFNYNKFPTYNLLYIVTCTDMKNGVEVMNGYEVKEFIQIQINF